MEIWFVSTNEQAWTACFHIPIIERVKGLLTKPNLNVFLVGRDLRRETEGDCVRVSEVRDVETRL